MHAWRQTDCLSITLNYYQDNRPFLEPRMLNLGPDGCGKSLSEFPLMQYGVAQLWKVFGQHEFIYRAIALLLFYLALLMLFKIMERIFKDSLIALVGALLLYTSPTLVYYAGNFIMNSPALSLAIMGLSCFFWYEINGKKRYFFVFILLFTLAGLFKITAMLTFYALISLFLLQLIGVRLREEGKVFKHPIINAISMLVVVFVQYLWYAYASEYNGIHNPNYFLLSIYPLWSMGEAELTETLQAVDHHLNWNYFRYSTLIIFLTLFAALFILIKKVSRFYFLLLLSTFCGAMAYVILFFRALNHHDYYVINLFIIFPLVFINVIYVIKEGFPRLNKSFLLPALLVVFLVHNTDFASSRMNDRYSPEGNNSSYYKYFKQYNGLGEYLSEIGIDKNQQILSLFDNSYNNTLYLMNRKGYTNYGIGQQPHIIEQKRRFGARYLVLPEGNQNKDLDRYLKRKVGQYKGLEIFEL